MANSTSTRSWPYAAGLVAIVLVFGGIALFGGDDSASSFTITGPESIQGQALANFTSDGTDQATGQQAPVVTGTALLEDGQVTVPAPGEPTIVVFLAHWCPHCQREVPRVREWLNQDGLPEGVQMRAVATGIDQNQNNYPPNEWLESENWTIPTVIDDGSIANAYGLQGYPFWAMVNADGTVVGRHSGELSVQQLSSIANSLASG